MISSNDDVYILVDYLNQALKKNPNKKRKINNEITYDEIIKELHLVTFERLLNTGPKILKLKGKELQEVLENMKEIFGKVIHALRYDTQVNKEMPEVIKLTFIAELSICRNIIDQIKTYSISNKNKTFSQCINNIKNEINKNNYSIKPTKKAKKNDEDEDYEPDSDDDTTDDEEETKLIEEKPTKISRKEGRDFVQEIFKTRDYGNEEEIINYFSKLPSVQRKLSLEHIKDINNYQSNEKPQLFKIMDMPLPLSQKHNILKVYTTLSNSRHSDNKLRNWFESLMLLPFGKYEGINLKNIKPKEVKGFLDNLQSVMDNAIYGHDEAKRQIIQMMGQQIRNPNAKGNMLGIWGPPGNGKSSLVKEGIAKAMNKPFIFISLGGATDASFLEGHSYTYEGSIYGRIANGLISSKCMDPIIYFDELDKISKSHKGEEITNILVHLTDPVQNSHFRDKYFHGIDIDLSRATMIFSFNDPSNVNPILLDRITTVETKYLLTSQKIHIAKNYLLPDIMKDMSLNNNDVTIDDNTIKSIIMNYTREGGVRKLKSLLYNIVRELNINNLIKGEIDNTKINFPFNVENKYLKSLLKHIIEVEPEKVHNDDKPGFINGLYCGSLGIGGILPIQVVWIPTTKPLSLKTTGNLQKVIKESTEVACSLAWNYLPDNLKNKYIDEWKNRPMGFHLHCPDGAVPKDGPSAGAALTLALYSLFTNKKIRHDIAMTGEINLEGNVTAIGGLEEKLEGAKRAGVKLVLFPKENLKHLEKIKERNETLLDDNFKVIAIDTFDEVLKYSLIEN